MNIYEEDMNMKKLINLLLSLTLVLALAGCGAEQSATYVLTQEEAGIYTMTDTQTIKAKGDIVYELTETTVADFTVADAETQALLAAYYDEIFTAMKDEAPEGVTVTYTRDGNVCTIEFVMDLTTADLQELIAGGYLMSLEEDASNVKLISFSQTTAGLEAGGYVLQQ